MQHSTIGIIILVVALILYNIKQIPLAITSILAMLAMGFFWNYRVVPGLCRIRTFGRSDDYGYDDDRRSLFYFRSGRKTGKSTV